MLLRESETAAGLQEDAADDPEDEDSEERRKTYSLKQLASQKKLKRYNAFMKGVWKLVSPEEKKRYSAQAVAFK